MGSLTKNKVLSFRSFSNMIRGSKFLSQNPAVLWIPLLLCAASVLIHYSDGLSEALQYDRGSIIHKYQLHRLVSSHFCHWTLRHMGYDTFFFGLLSLLYFVFHQGSSSGIRYYGIYILALSLGIGGVVHFLYPKIIYYRGLSGLDWGLYGIFAIQLWRLRHWFWKSGAFLMIVLFGIKLGLQIKSGQSMFVGDMGPGVVNMPGVHAAGLIGGILLAALLKPRSCNS
jgi:hypothetical protein